MDVGGRGILYTYRYTVTTKMIPALRWAAMRAIFNVSVGCDGQSHRTVSSNHSLFEEKGEPKRYRTEVLPLITPYREAKPAHHRTLSTMFTYFKLLQLTQSVLPVCLTAEQW